MTSFNPTREPLTIWWIKRDFRLYDNEALNKAIELGHNVLPLFVFEPEIMRANDFSPMHLHAHISAAHDLRVNLQAINSEVMFANGEITQVIAKLAESYAIQAIVSHEETGNDISFKRDKRLAAYLKNNRIDWQEYPQNGVIRRLKTRDDRQGVINERLFNTEPIPAPTSIPQSSQLIELASRTSLPNVFDYYSRENTEPINFDQLQAVSETAAWQCLGSFLNNRAKGYSGGISSPNTAFINGSRLSPHIAWGTISLRTLFAETQKRYEAINAPSAPSLFSSISEQSRGSNEMSPAQLKQWRRSLNAFQSRLYWHCHFIQRLESAPNMEFVPLNRAYRSITYENSEELLNAWCTGKTGFPLVDACMRCLNSIGFINFRMRAFVVSFAIFGLHLDWRAIHPHLARIFYDYEPGIHLAQLQMQAGIVGINTIRVYSPTKQLIDQDPQCRFVKKWIPELRSFAISDIQSYETIPLDDYPKPIIDFSQRSNMMKDQISAIRKSQAGRIHSKNVLEKHGSRKSMRKKSKKDTVDSPQLNLF